MNRNKSLEDFIDELREWQNRDNGIVLGGMIVKHSPESDNYITTTRGLHRFIDDIKDNQKAASDDQGEFEWFHLLLNEIFQNAYDKTHCLDNEKRVSRARNKLYKKACDILVKIANMR